HREEFARQRRQLVVGEDKQFVFLKPELQGIVRHRGWTRKGLLRLPEFVQFC
ncbi:DNA ligase-1, partial [Paenibacillus sp. UNC496MF]